MSPTLLSLKSRFAQSAADVLMLTGDHVMQASTRLRCPELRVTGGGPTGPPAGPTFLEVLPLGSKASLSFSGVSRRAARLQGSTKPC